MFETYGENIFDKIPTASAICITTNCTILEDDTNPMPGGVAGAAVKFWSPYIQGIYGYALRTMPHVPCIIGYAARNDPPDFVPVSEFMEDEFASIQDEFCAVVAFPTMRSITSPASFKLVKRSAELLVELADINAWTDVYLASPGTGIGGLDVKKVHSALKEIFCNDACSFTVMQR